MEKLTAVVSLTHVCRSYFYQLRQLKSAKSSLTREVFHSFIQAFVHCRLDYCNSALAGVAKLYLQKLQSVQNIAPRMVSGVHWSEQITPVLEDLHWLPASQRIVFKTALMVWKYVHAVAPVYLSDLCIPATAISGRQHLRSAATGTLLVPRAQTATGQWSFAVNRPATWNHLPPALQSSDLSESASKRALKTHLFLTTRRHWDVFIILAPDINIQTYLLTVDHRQPTKVRNLALIFDQWL